MTSTEINRALQRADATLTIAEAELEAAHKQIAALREYADQAYPHAPWPRRRSVVTYLRWLTGWARLVFMIWTHRIVRLAPGAYLQIQRGVSNERVLANLAAYLRNQKGKHA